MAVVPDRTLGMRIREHRRVSAALAAHQDSTLTSLIEASGDGVFGIGGAGTRVDVDGVAVFAKRISLTDLEREPTMVGSTANVFGLPAHCHYGVGSPGFSAWRELAAARTTSGWVLCGLSEHFPLLHHWRVLPGATPPGDELHDIEASVAYWGGHPAMRHRLHALADASASLVLFLEHIPFTLAGWIAEQQARGDQAAVVAAAMLESQLLDGAAFMTSHGLLHFDAHFTNVLTDGRLLYFADLGLAASTDFALSADETALVGHAQTHDIAYAITRLVNWTTSTFGDPSATSDPVARNDYVRALAHGGTTLPPEPAAGILRRYAPVAAIVNAFYAELFTIRRDTPYPAHAIDAQLDRLAAAGQLPPSITATYNR